MTTTKYVIPIARKTPDPSLRPRYACRMNDGCPLPSLNAPPRSDRLSLIREAFWLEWLTIGWMTVEAGVAIFAGWTANSLVLIAFGFDSVIELASAGVLVWRLNVELRHG
jgi:hypothetical protein